MTVISRVSPRHTDDDSVDDLPPIDGDDEETSELPLEDHGEGELVDDDGDTDDSVAEDLAIGELVEPLSDDAMPAGEDPGELDIGEAVLGFGESAPVREDDDTGGLAGDDLTLGIDEIPETGQGDAADEAVMGGAEAEVDEARFPELDSDDDNDLPGEIVVDETEVTDDVPLPEWTVARWERVGIPLIAEPMTCVWIGAERVVAAGDGAVELMFGGDRAADARRLELSGLPPGEIVSVHGDDDDRSSMLIATHHGVYVSLDGGATVGAPTFRSPGEASVVSVTACSRRLQTCYAQMSDGALFASRYPCGAWKQLDGVGNVRAIAQDETGSVSMLAIGEEPAVLRFYREGRCETEPLAAGADASLRSGGAWIAAGQNRVLFGATNGAVWTSGPTGDWQVRRVTPEACSAAVVDTGAGPFAVVAVYVESADRSYLLRLDDAGVLELVGDLSPDVVVPAGGDGDESDSMGRVLTIAWDDRRGWLWVAGRFGLQAWRPVFPA